MKDFYGYLCFLLVVHGPRFIGFSKSRLSGHLLASAGYYAFSDKRKKAQT